MVRLHLKRGDESKFLYDTTTKVPVTELVAACTEIFNGRLKIERLCAQIQMLADHGISKPSEAIGLTDEQVVEMKIQDLWTPKCYPSGGSVFNRDDIGIRTGNAPKPELAQVLRKTVDEAKEAISKKRCQARKPMTMDDINAEFDKLKGAVMIVYPMGLPPYDEVSHILNGTENLAGRQDATLVVDPEEAEIWWAGKQMMPGKTLGDYVGKNEKTTLIAKLQKRGGGAPVREPVVDAETQKQMMAHAYKKQEEWKKLEEANDDAYLNQPWADSSSLKRSMHGTGNISWRPR